MPPASRPHDPFNDAPPRRPASRTATTHFQDVYTSSGHALRSATASSRNLFATSLSRRPINAAAAAAAAAASSSSAHVSNEVLEDPDHGEDDRTSGRRAAAATVTNARPRTRRTRAATAETTVEPDEEGKESGDLVIRDKTGNYLRLVPLAGEQESGIEDEQRAEDARLTSITREYWVSGGGVSGRGSRRMDDEEIRLQADVMIRLREAVDKKLTGEKWVYEPTDYLEDLRIRNHGV